MKIIEAMKQVKANKAKIADLNAKIKQHSAHLTIETPLYENPADKIKEWTQSALDTSRDNVELLVRIAKTNLATMVSIDLGDGKTPTKSIAEWVWRRREYAAMDLTVWQSQSDRGLKEQNVQASPGGQITEIRIVRNYQPEVRDREMARLQREASLIDGTLEVVNATTDLLN